MRTIQSTPDNIALRRRAEKEFETAADSVDALTDMSPEKTASLVHELQVHQIELDMQNDELRRIQLELESARDRYAELYEFAPSGYASISAEGRILETNLTCARLLGGERGLLPGNYLSRFIAADAQDKFYFLLRELFKTKSPQTCELKLKGKGAVPIHARLDCIVKEDAADRRPYILVAMTDITENRRAREILQQSHEELARQVDARTLALGIANDQLNLEIDNLKLAQTALRESEERYRSLVESTDDSIYLVDENCNYLFMNQKHKERLGLVSSPVKGTTYSACHSMQETEAFRAKVKAVFAAGQSQSYEYRSDKSGSYYIRTLSPVMEGETVMAVSVISKNMTAQKQAEMEARQSRLELAHIERLITMGELTASLAHELRQPLTTILSNAQAASRFVQGNPPEIDEVRASLQDIIAAVSQADEFIKHLRAFFKKGELNKKPLNIKDLINKTLALVRNETALKKISIQKAVDGQLPAVEADDIHLQQVILNLILNASESMREVNDRPRRIVISTLRENASCLKIGIGDSGRGIDKDHLEAIFKPYFTTKKDGMGLGLAICRSIVEAHHGLIWAENNPDQGATVYFTLPIADEG